MEEGRRLTTKEPRTKEQEYRLKQEQLPNIMAYGLIICAILIIFSVEYFYRAHKYVELAVTTAVFMVILFLIRWFKFK